MTSSLHLLHRAIADYAAVGTMQGMLYVSTKDHERPDGGLDFKSYYAAQVKQGERCHQCRNYIGLGSGLERSCHQCQDINKPGDLRHDRYLRCPKCGHTWQVPGDDGDWCHVMEEGEHEVCCPSCDQNFEISTYVEYSFRSPPLGENEADESEADESEAGEIGEED